MWESLLAGVVGGLLVSGFSIVAGALLWIKQQRWNQKREIYAELLPMLGRYYVVNRLITATMLRIDGGVAEDPKRFQQWMDERDALFSRIDSKYGYFKLFVSSKAAAALTGVLEAVHGVAEEMMTVQAAPADERHKQREEFLRLGKGQAEIVTLTENALRAVQKSASDDLRFAFEIPITGYVIGEQKPDSHVQSV